jgi:hypothetical protein
MQPIYLICGVPGSGKSWCINQLKSKFEVLEHDTFIGYLPKDAYCRALIKLAKIADKPILGDCPFMISVLIEALIAKGADVRPYFIIELPHIVKSRYESRELKTIPKQHITRIATVVERAAQYKAPKGTSKEVLEMLKKE